MGFKKANIPLLIKNSEMMVYILTIRKIRTIRMIKSIRKIRMIRINFTRMEVGI